MKYVVRIGLLLLIAVLAYFTYESIAAPVRYKAEVEKIEAKIIDRLKILRDGELAYKDVHSRFADNFDSLLNFMENGEMTTLIQDGNVDDSTTVFTSREVAYSVKDSLFRNVDVMNLKYVPDMGTLEFKIAAGTLKKNNVTVPVFEIKDPEPFSVDRQYKNNPLKVGSIFAVNYNGNWK
ncbi:MAG: hypothetical protein COA58_14205 [Bacteroidetes bacterium]|nr:MAG: hypothetical protein COA58_14205 [Bacteroidota bacterium]